MKWTHLPRSLVLVPALALPASAQEPPIVSGPPQGEWSLAPGGPPALAPVTPPERPGLFGWRRRQAERKRHLQETFLGFPEEFNEWQLGRSLYDNGRAEVANGLVSRLILNDCDFIGDSAELNYRGLDKLAAIAARLPICFDPVIVERTPRAPRIAEARRLAIVGMLEQGRFPVPPERVLVAPSISRGLTGTEAILANSIRMNSFANGGGSLAGTGLSGVGNTGGSGSIAPLSSSR